MRDGPSEVQTKLYEELVAAGRRLGEVLVKEDVDALEDRSALGDMGQYVALRQIRQTTARIESRLPHRPVRPLVGRKEVPTRVLDEDQYPVGGIHLDLDSRFDWRACCTRNSPTWRRNRPICST